MGRNPPAEALPVPLEQVNDSVSDIDGNDDREDPSSETLLEYLRSCWTSESSSMDLVFFILGSQMLCWLPATGKALPSHQ